MTDIAKRWKGVAGLVHIIRLPDGTRTYCGYIVLVTISEITRESHYTCEPVTCLVCMYRGPEEQHADP